MAARRPAAAGYSGTPLAKKLGLVEGATLHLMSAPSNYAALVGPPMRTLRLARKADRSVDVVHLFTASRSRLAHELASLRTRLRPDAVVWVSWPKKAAGVPTDVTEDTIRDLALPLDFVDIKVCAVDETWSGLKLMVRRDRR